MVLITISHRYESDTTRLSGHGAGCTEVSTFTTYSAYSQTYASMSRIKLSISSLPLTHLSTVSVTSFAQYMLRKYVFLIQFLNYESISSMCLHRPIWKSWCITEFVNAIITQREGVSMTHNSFQKYIKKNRSWVQLHYFCPLCNCP